MTKELKLGQHIEGLKSACFFQVNFVNKLASTWIPKSIPSASSKHFFWWFSRYVTKVQTAKNQRKRPDLRLLKVIS